MARADYVSVHLYKKDISGRNCLESSRKNMCIMKGGDIELFNHVCQQMRYRGAVAYTLLLTKRIQLKECNPCRIRLTSRRHAQDIHIGADKHNVKI